MRDVSAVCLGTCMPVAESQLARWVRAALRSSSSKKQHFNSACLSRHAACLYIFWSTAHHNHFGTILQPRLLQERRRRRAGDHRVEVCHLTPCAVAVHRGVVQSTARLKCLVILQLPLEKQLLILCWYACGFIPPNTANGWLNMPLNPKHYGPQRGVGSAHSSRVLNHLSAMLYRPSARQRC